jgi:hypothetical protein
MGTMDGSEVINPTAPATSFELAPTDTDGAPTHEPPIKVGDEDLTLPDEEHGYGYGV